MTVKSLDTRRAARLAARETERKGDAELDAPLLAEMLAVAEGKLAEAAAAVSALSAQLIVTTTSTGLPIAQHAANAVSVAKNLATITKVLIADADAALKD